MVYCLICGCSDSEASKMHHFPTNSEKCKLWHDNLGIKYNNRNMKNYYLCSNHFDEHCYVDKVTWKLKRNALPMKYMNAAASSEMNVNTESHMENCQPLVAGPSRDIHIDFPTEIEKSCDITKKINKSVFRGIPGVSRKLSTPRKLKMMKLIESKESHIRSLKKLAKSRADNMRQLCSLGESSVVKELFKDMPSVTADFLITQLKCSNKSPKGRRWTINEKVLALALFKRGPKCYNLLRKIVAMPSKKTLTDLLGQVPFESGINIHILQHINNSIKSDEDRVCALLLDEMDIKEHIQYDSQRDRIRGYEEAGSQSSALANKALVFMVKGIQSSWKQPVAYYFTNNAMSGSVLSKLIIEVIEACQNVAHLDIVATINDCGTNNVKALKQLGSSVQTPFIQCGGKKIFTIYDPPHLLKCTVSLFRKHNVNLPVPSLNNSIMEARFGDIRRAHEIDSTSPLIFRAMHKIKSNHLEPKMQYAMKVSIAGQLMSRTVSSFLYTLLSRGELEQRSIATATFVHQIDELFDSFNGSARSPPDGKNLKCMLSEVSGHMKYWEKAYEMIEKLEFIRHFKKGGLRTSKPPSQIAWLTTLKAIRELWVYVSVQKNIQFLKPRTLNQDSLENLFGAIRSGLGCNDNPTTIQFVGSLKTQILNGLVNLGTGRNCEDDDGILLSNLNSFLKTEETVTLEDGQLKEVGSNIHIENLASDIANAVDIGSVSTVSVAYVGGFIIKKILQYVEDCNDCKSILLSDPSSPHNIFISFKEWSQNKTKLIYPSEQPIVTVGIAINLLEDFLKNNSAIPNLSKHVEKLFTENLDFQWITCHVHKDIVIKAIIKAVYKIGVPWWCKRYMRDVRDTKRDSTLKKVKIFNH